jgi:hypothetical protein
MSPTCKPRISLRRNTPANPVSKSALSREQSEESFTAFLQQLGAAGMAPGATILVMEGIGNYQVALDIAVHRLLDTSMPA